MIALLEVTQRASDLPDNGGPAILIPALVLFFGSGILTWVIPRRR